MGRMPTLYDAYRAHARIKPMIRQTPLIAAPDLVEKTGAEQIHLKLECLQETGSFKVRGAANKILSLSDEEKKKGVITFSTGNHGKAVAHVAGRLGIRAVICLSNRVPRYRVNVMKALGAEVVCYGQGQDQAYERALEMTKQEGLVMVNPFDDKDIIAGQGTIALEILEQLPQVETIVIPVSGGGLISGIALVLKAANPRIRVIGVSMAVAPAMYHCIKAGKPVEIEEKDSLADALLGGIGLDNRFTFSLVQNLVDDIILVSEAEIEDGMFYALDQEHLVLEGSGSVGISALISGKISHPGACTVAVLSGGNVDMQQLSRIAAERYMARFKKSK